MTRDTFLYGCRSGIQKAVRRGDLGLAKTCFTHLWGEKEHRNWLKWRTPVLVVEEGVHLAGEYAKMYKNVQSIAKNTNEERDEWKKFIYRLTASRKGKDAGGLSLLAEILMGRGKRDNVKREIAVAMEIRRRMAREKANDVADDIFKRVCNGEFGEVDEYAKSASQVYRARAKAGGMACDKIQCVIAMTMIAMRGLKGKEVESIFKGDLDAAKSRVGPKLKAAALPWYCFDMHTRPGRMALGVFIRNFGEKYKLTEGRFDEVWFFMESGWSPKELVQFPENIDAPKMWENRWWDLVVRSRGVFGNKKYDEVRKLWDDEMRKEIKGIVEWAMGRV